MLPSESPVKHPSRGLLFCVAFAELLREKCQGALERDVWHAEARVCCQRANVGRTDAGRWMSESYSWCQGRMIAIVIKPRSLKTTAILGPSVTAARNRAKHYKGHALPLKCFTSKPGNLKLEKSPTKSTF